MLMRLTRVTNTIRLYQEALAPLPDAEDGSTPSAAESGVPAQPTPAARLTTLDGPTVRSLRWLSQLKLQ